MGGLWKRMPVTWLTSLVGSLALIGFPFFAGFYSKDSIIEAVAASSLPFSGVARFAVTAGVFITAFYSFRMFFLVFHGAPRFEAGAQGPEDHAHGLPGHEGHDGHHALDPHESPGVVTWPLILLAIPSVLIGAIAVGAMVGGEFFGASIFTDVHRHPAMEELARGFHGWLGMAFEGFAHLPFWLAMAGVAGAWALYLKWTDLPGRFVAAAPWLYRLLDQKYYLDRINEFVFAGGARSVGRGLWQGGDVAIIDGVVVNGSASAVGRLAQLVRRVQTGFLYQYALVMLIGVGLMIFLFLTWPYYRSLTGGLR